MTGRNSAVVNVHKVVCAVDCGMVVNPWTVKAQMEGGIVFGLTQAKQGSSAAGPKRPRRKKKGSY